MFLAITLTSFASLPECGLVPPPSGRGRRDSRRLTRTKREPDRAKPQRKAEGHRSIRILKPSAFLDAWLYRARASRLSQRERDPALSSLFSFFRSSSFSQCETT